MLGCPPKSPLWPFLAQANAPSEGLRPLWTHRRRHAVLFQGPLPKAWRPGSHRTVEAAPQHLRPAPELTPSEVRCKVSSVGEQTPAQRGRINSRGGVAVARSGLRHGSCGFRFPVLRELVTVLNSYGCGTCQELRGLRVSRLQRGIRGPSAHPLNCAVPTRC